jgi:hypothetical protein
VIFLKALAEFGEGFLVKGGAGFRDCHCEEFDEACPERSRMGGNSVQREYACDLAIRDL